MQANPKLPTTPPLPGVVAVPALNDAFQAIATNFSGDTDPAALTGPFFTWADTANSRLKRRNAANTAWVDIGPLFGPDRFYEQGAEPDVDVGDIYINGIGPCRWNSTDNRYYSIPGTRGLRLRFNATQSWTPDVYSKTASRVVVQGGGAGGGYGGSGASISGGGGAGGAPGVTIDRTNITLTPGIPMTVTVGAGGAGATATTPNPSGGGTSSFAGLSAAGGVSSGGNGDLVWGGVPRGPGSAPGGNGTTSTSGPAGSGGTGGGTIFGHGGTAGSRSGTAGEAGLQGGSAPVANSGAGGGGAGGSLATTSFRFGGDGAAGCVIVEL